MAGRWCEVTVIIAAKKYGKSTFAENITRRNSLKNALIYKEGVNLYDEAFKGYKVIDDITKYKGGKVIVNGGKIAYKDFLVQVKKYYRNGILLIDDAAVYERNDVSDELLSILVDSRKLGIDVIMMFHGLNDIPIRIFTYVNNVILGHCATGFEYKINKLPNGTELIEASKRIAAQVAKGNRFYREFIKLA